MSLIDLTNFSEHPTEPSWLVFRYPTAQHAQEMVRLLAKENIKTEADLIDGPPFMVGVGRRHFTLAEKLNYTVLGTFRKPMIANKFWRYALIVFFVALMTVAIIGMLKAQ